MSMTTRCRSHRRGVSRCHFVGSREKIWPMLSRVCIVFVARQTPIGHKTYEDLTSRYVFHFVGDSTTRRLAEGFFSIATGTALPHEYYHDRRNFTIGNLQVRTTSRSTLQVEDFVYNTAPGVRTVTPGNVSRLVIFPYPYATVCDFFMAEVPATHDSTNARGARLADTRRRVHGPDTTYACW